MVHKEACCCKKISKQRLVSLVFGRLKFGHVFVKYGLVRDTKTLSEEEFSKFLFPSTYLVKAHFNAEYTDHNFAFLLTVLGLYFLNYT